MKKIIDKNYRRNEFVREEEEAWLPNDEGYNGCLNLPNDFKDLIIAGAFESGAYYRMLSIFSDWTKTNEGMDIVEKLYNTFEAESAIDKETLNKINEDKHYNDILCACIKYLDAIVKADIDEAEKKKQTDMILELLKLLINFTKNIPDDKRDERNSEQEAEYLSISSDLAFLYHFIGNTGENKPAEIMCTDDLKKILDTIGLLIRTAANCKCETFKKVYKLFYPSAEQSYLGYLYNSKDREAYFHIMEETIRNSKKDEIDESVNLMAEIIIEVDRTWYIEHVTLLGPEREDEPLMIGVKQVEMALAKLKTKGYRSLLCLPYICKLYTSSYSTNHYIKAKMISETEIIEALIRSEDEDFLVGTAKFLEKLYNRSKDGIKTTVFPGAYPIYSLDFMSVIYFIKKALEDEDIKKLVSQELYAKPIDEKPQTTLDLERILIAMDYLAEIIRAKKEIWPYMTALANIEPPLPSKTIYDAFDIMRAEGRGGLTLSEWHEKPVQYGRKINSYPYPVTEDEEMFFGSYRSSTGEAELVMIWPETPESAIRVLVPANQVMNHLEESQYLVFCKDYERTHGHIFNSDSEERVYLPAYIKTKKAPCKRQKRQKRENI